MTPNEPSAQPRKRSWKRLILVVACVVAVITIVLLAFAPKKEPVKVWFVRATNELSEKRLLFEGTNESRKAIRVIAATVTGAVPDMKTKMGSGKNIYDSFPGVPAGENFYFYLKKPPKDAAYYVVWGFYHSPESLTRWERFRAGCYWFFFNHGAPRLADRFYPWPKPHYIPSTEIKE